MVAAAGLVVMMVLAASFNVWTLRQRVERDAQANLSKLALLIAEQTARSFQSVDLVLKEIVNHISIADYESPAAFHSGLNGPMAHQFLREHAVGMPQITNIIVASADGVIANTSQSWPPSAMSIADREQFQYLRDHDSEELYFSTPVLSRVDGLRTMYVGRRVNSRTGTFLGVAQVAVKLKYFEEFYRAVSLGEGSSILLARSDGMLLARYPSVEGLIGTAIDTPPSSLNGKGDRYSDAVLIAPGFDGVTRFVSRRRVSEFPLTISTTMTKEEVLRNWRNDAAILLIGAFGAVAGVVLLFVALWRKIRRARASQQLLTESNLRIARDSRLLLDAQRIGRLGHWIGDAAGDSAEWSPYLFEIAGLPPAPAVPFEQLLSLVHPDDLESFLRERAQSRANATMMVHEHRWIRPDGEIRWVRIEAKPRLDANGNRLGIFGIVQDITERRLAEEAVKASQHLLTDAIESISQGFVLYDKDDRFVVCNSHFRVIFPEMASVMQPGMLYQDVMRAAYHAGAFVGLDLDNVGMEAWLARVVAWHESASLPLERLYHNGRWIRLTDHRTSDGGIVGLRTDITDFKTIEAALELKVSDLEKVSADLETQKLELIATSADLTLAKDAAEAASRAKSDFLAIMSHEIRTPMSGMVGMIDLLRETPLNDEQRDYTALARESANGLLTVINDILDFSKLDAGQLSLEAIDFDVRQLIRGVNTLMQAGAQAQGLEISTSLAPGLPDWLNGDPGRIRQIILNLVSNAVKFSERGSVSISASHRDLGGGQIELRIEVIDSGIGITPEVQQRLFNPFVQADTSISRKYGGTGLGLAICKQLCATMGGMIGVDSTHNRGSTFWFTVRCAPGNPIVVAPPLAPAADADRSLRVLVAEDSPIIATLVSKLLSKRGINADIVCNGALAVDSVQAKAYDLVLMDVQMPVLDGISATRAIRALTGLERNVPIIALTANALVGQRESYLAAGMNDYVTKPIQPDLLYAAIERWGHHAAAALA
jgi:PAS domain S-box-containing protein